MRRKRALLPLRRVLSRLVLVDDERANRARELQALEAALTERLEAMVDRDVRRLLRENAAILRLLSQPAGASDAGPVRVTQPVSRDAVFREVERGSREEVMAKLSPYVPRFHGLEPVVDLGCGAGEFLQLARDVGITAYGVEIDGEAVSQCRELGLDAREEDLFSHLASATEGTLGGVFMSQVVEHLAPATIPDLMTHVARVLAPGGVAVVETPNPATFATHVHSFWRDPTHIRPVPEAALSFAARSAGLVVEEVLYSSPLPDEERLKHLPGVLADPEVQAVADAFNAAVDRLNQVLFGFQDYALVLSKPAATDR
jgi:O-antigen chain-terminating methyltransferase